MNDQENKNRKECPSCAMMVDAKEIICPICGYEFPKDSFAFKLLVLILISAVILFFIL